MRDRLADIIIKRMEEIEHDPSFAPEQQLRALNPWWIADQFIKLVKQENCNGKRNE